MNKYNNQPLEQAFQAKINTSKRTYQQGRGGSSRGRFPGRGRGRFSPNGGRGRGRKDFSSHQNSGNSNDECFVCGKSGHESKDCWWKCTRCKIPNHSDKDCWFKKKEERSDAHEAANFSQADEENKLFCSMSTKEELGRSWYLDSGCSNHVTGNEKEFHILENYSSHIELGDGNQVKIDGKGAVAVHTNRGKTFILMFITLHVFLRIC